MKRIYGNEKTHIILSEKAQTAYSDTDPIQIIERDADDDGFIYDIKGAVEISNLTAEQVIDVFEEMYEEFFTEEEDNE